MTHRFFFNLLLVVSIASLLTISSEASANVAIVGTPWASATLRQWGSVFTAATNIEVNYVEALDDVSTSELFVGIYDMAVVEYPMPTHRLSDKGLVQFPLLGVGVAVVINLPGIPSNAVRLDANVLAAIYLGQITVWNDPRITELNPHLSLPAIPVVPVAQSDGSVVTLNFTRYLASGSELWRKSVGLGSGLIWPLGAGEKDGGAAAKTLLARQGAVGFQSWRIVSTSGLNTVQLKNAHGAFVKPTPEGFASTLKDFLGQSTTDFSAPVNVKTVDAWPIMAVVYGQMKKIPEDVPDAQETVQMLTQVLQGKIPGANEQIPVDYQDIAAALSQIQTSKRFGPPQKKRNGS